MKNPGKAAQALRRIASRHADVEQGVACKGTSLESTTFGVRRKVFLFMRVTDGVFNLRLRLGDSRGEAAKLAAKEPGRYAIGAGGWAKVTFSEGDAAPLDLLERWIDESHAAVVGPRPDAKRSAGAKPKTSASRKRAGVSTSAVIGQLAIASVERWPRRSAEASLY